MFNDHLYKIPFHEADLSQYKFLITGGAGFIGSNIVEYLLKFGAGHVRVLDNLSNGYFENIKQFSSLSNFEFIEGDIRDFEMCKIAVSDIDFISHQAALGSVPRSINDPLNTNEVNITGFLNVLLAAKESAKLKKFVYAASSSSYGDSLKLPKIEGNEGNPLSPYAVTKLVNELYAEVFSRIYNLHTIGLRYFNVFGPKQNPNNPYAAVIPIFCKHFIEGSQPTINGDGETSRDFTFVENAVQANIKSFFNVELKKHEIINIACGDQTSINQLVRFLEEISGKRFEVNYVSARVGDVKHSRADISKAKRLIHYDPKIDFNNGLRLTYHWYQNNKGYQ